MGEKVQRDVYVTNFRGWTRASRADWSNLLGFHCGTRIYTRMPGLRIWCHWFNRALRYNSNKSRFRIFTRQIASRLAGFITAQRTIAEGGGDRWYSSHACYLIKYALFFLLTRTIAQTRRTVKRICTTRRIKKVVQTYNFMFGKNSKDYWVTRERVDYKMNTRFARSRYGN